MRKTYGQSRIESCLFCGGSVITTNVVGIPVCVKHKTAVLNDFKCMCGDYLDLRKGKFGVFFSCFNCGNVSMAKALELNDVRDVS